MELSPEARAIQRTPEGFAIRQKLIELEQRAGVAMEALSPELRLLINLEVKQREQDRAIESVNKRLTELEPMRKKRVDRASVYNEKPPHKAVFSISLCN